MRSFSSYHVTYYDQVSQDNSSIFSFEVALFKIILWLFRIIQINQFNLTGFKSSEWRKTGASIIYRR